MKKLFLLLTVLLALSCSQEQLESETNLTVSSEEQLVNVTSANDTKTHLGSKILIECTGYGFYENKQYDCGWKRGYDDWVFQYNYERSYMGFPDCYDIKVEVYAYGDSTRFRTVWITTDNSPAIIQSTQNSNYPYYNQLFDGEQYPSDYKRGQQAGYSAGRGQVPYAANDNGGCN